jgi:FKBP-type peptidyl-prolyl cis-trans isomerase (trigger factor)
MHDFQVPDSLTRAVLESLLQDMARQYPKKQLPDDFDYDRFGRENYAYAQAQAKWALLREELLKAESITVDDADLEKLAESEASTINVDKERLLQYYKSSDQVRDRLRSDKLMQRLISQATIIEVDDTELTNAPKG